MSEQGIINVSVSNHYRECLNTTDITTQGWLGERVKILEQRQTHVYIRQNDSYRSWVPEDQIVPAVDFEGHEVMVRSHFMRIYAQPSISSEGVRDAVIGCRLTAVDEQEFWYKVVLPDGTFGWAEKKHFGTIGQFSVENVIALAREFLGYQYFWGGRTPKGFDCSGYVQTVFQLHGVQMLRDAWLQQHHHQVSTDYRDAKQGDLLFFSDRPDKVTHVAISLGEQKFIHASGWVRINSFIKNDPDFSSIRKATFTSVNRYRPQDHA